MRNILKDICLGVLLVSVSSIQAAVIYWEGNVDNLYTNGANWSTGSEPANNDYSDKIYFNDSYALTNSCHISLGRSINAIVFQDAGYTLTGKTILTKYLSSSGTGTNRIEDLKAHKSNYTWTIGEGNTLIIDSLYQDGSNKKLTFKGGGTVIFENYINGYASINYQQINDVLMIVRSSKVYIKDYVTKLNEESSELQLKTSVAAAETMGRVPTIVKILDV